MISSKYCVSFLYQHTLNFFSKWIWISRKSKWKKRMKMRLNDDGRGTHIFLLLTKITFELSGSIKRSLYLGLLALIYWVKVPDQTTINTFTITYWKRGGWMLWLSSMMRYRIAQANAQTHLHFVARLWQSSGHKTLLARIWVTQQHVVLCFETNAFEKIGHHVLQSIQFFWIEG